MKLLSTIKEVSKVLLILLGMTGLTEPRHSAASPPADGVTRLESELLHLRPDLSDLLQWQRDTKQWTPYRRSRASLLIVNLWARSCPPCLQEFQVFKQLLRQLPRTEVEMIFVAAAEDTSQQEVEQFWSHPLIELPANTRCGGIPVSSRSCLVELPESAPVFAPSTRFVHSLRSFPILPRPLTLLMDGQSSVRHIFAGSIESRQTELKLAIERLRQALQRESSFRSQHLDRKRTP
ncbi:MAG: hypothetical protein JNM83_20000 [Myxococcales bacterium]|nr:hypothetical protein [Myxococcales bacterium]